MTVPSPSDPLTDDQNCVWTPGATLGRGTWGRSRLVQDNKGRTAVLKTPLRVADFAGEPDREALAAACLAIAEEQIERLRGRHQPHKPKLLGVIELVGGGRGYLLPRYTESLTVLTEARGSLEDALRTVVDVGDALASTSRIHGNLRPSNVFFGPEREIILADLASPAVHPVRTRIAALSGVTEWTPPEAEGRARASWDSWALGQLLHAACHAPPGVDPAPPPRLSVGGLDRDELQLLKQRVLTRLGDDESNPRFRTRVADRLGALLSRALSAQAEPSPPYRFDEMEAFTARVREVLDLISPRVEEVGRILFPGRADDAVFEGDGPVEFTVSVACTQGVSDLDDMICGVQLRDLDTPDQDRVPLDDVGCEVQTHPSGRLRFRLSLPGVAPGRYAVRTAFAVRDSGNPPVVQSTELEVRPAPGYVPPRHDLPPPTPLEFPVRPIAETSPGIEDEDADPTDHGTSAAAPDSRWEPPPPPELIDEPEVYEDPDLFPAMGSDPDVPVLIDEGSPPLHAGPDPEPVFATIGDDDPTPLPMPRPVQLHAHAPAPPPDPLPELRPVELVANIGEDLPNWRQAAESDRQSWLSRLADAVRKDTTWALAMAIVSSISLVVAVSLLASAC